MPPAPRQNEDPVVWSDDDDPVESYTKTTKPAPQQVRGQIAPKRAVGLNRVVMPPQVVIRTTILAAAAVYALRSWGLFETQFWLATFLTTCAIDASSPALNNFSQYIFPFALIAHKFPYGGDNGQIIPGLAQWILFMPTVAFLIGVPMSVCLHRYFSHAAFSTSRPMQALIGVVACMAYQGGPLWWSAKHGRHHHYCDQPNDPHSVVQHGFSYAFVGWTVNPVNYVERDVNYNNPSLLVPELIFLDKYYLLPVALLFTILEQQFGVDRAFIAWSMLLPMLVCRLVTWLFNVQFHPAHDPRRCASVDNDRFLAVLVGESEHATHHRCPNKSKRNQRDVPCKSHIFVLYCIVLLV
jgi:stearoyl-CoA desaturase (delta-9 desaturase)